jgi:hypothetical protein
MTTTRRDLLKGAAGLTIAAIVPMAPARPDEVYTTGSATLDRQLDGGLRAGTLTVVVGPRGGGKSRFMAGLACANGIADHHAADNGTSDMLSIARRSEGKHFGTLAVNSVEPHTDKEWAAMQSDPAARDAFLSRWLRRSREVVADLGGILVYAVAGDWEDAVRRQSKWVSLPDHVIIRPPDGEWTLAARA